MRAETQRQLECLSRNCVPNEPLDQDDICGVGNSCWIPVRILLLTYWYLQGVKWQIHRESVWMWQSLEGSLSLVSALRQRWGCVCHCWSRNAVGSHPTDKVLSARKAKWTWKVPLALELFTWINRDEFYSVSDQGPVHSQWEKTHLKTSEPHECWRKPFKLKPISSKPHRNPQNLREEPCNTDMPTLQGISVSSRLYKQLLVLVWERKAGMNKDLRIRPCLWVLRSFSMCGLQSSSSFSSVLFPFI